MKNKKLTSVMVFPSGNVAVFDSDRKQVPSLQINLLTYWASLADGFGYDVDGVIVETPSVHFRLIKHKSGGFGIEEHRP